MSTNAETKAVHDFDQLASWRKTIQDFCLTHAESVLYFETDGNFRILSTQPSPDKTNLKHLTNTATCIESLLRASGGQTDEKEAKKVREIAARFARLAVDRPQGEWLAENSAPIYARCRGLPLLIKFLEAKHPPEAVDTHLTRIFSQLNQPKREAIGEEQGGQPKREATGEAAPQSRASTESEYPPNAYHTYWALEILAHYKGRWPKATPQGWNANSINNYRSTLLEWAESSVATQIALHKASSPDLDSDQLALSLAIMSSFGSAEPEGLSRKQQSLTIVGLECLFDTQEKNGTWKRYRPLFNFLDAGNAYCYIFETFDALVGSIARSKSPALTQALAPYAGRLMKLLAYADATRVALDAASRAYGWCSGNTTYRTVPEAWATASVYAFAESLRIMMGVWTREAAIRDFRFKRFPKPSPEAEDSLWKHLHERGDNWHPKGEPSVAENLAITFIHPTCAAEDSFDPDSPPISDEHARSAILFGPPGASKTTIVETVAKILGWDFIEIHSSDFLADGMQQVHRTADRIFKKLTNLDRCVILFDEIDELVRQRDDGEADSFGRFLTTAMLPKIAELWKRRRALFFLATNHIKSFDDAIIRSERFDNLIFVSPPSFDAKKRILCKELKKVTRRDWAIVFEQDGIDHKVREIAAEVAKAATSDCGDVRSSPVARTYRPAQLAVLRYDQLSELAHNIATLSSSADASEVSEDLLIRGLEEMRDQRSARKGAYADIIDDRLFDRRDHRMQMYWQVIDFDGRPTTIIDFDGRPSTIIHTTKGKDWYKTNADFSEQLVSEQHKDDGFTLVRNPQKPGTLTFTSTTPWTPSPDLDPGGTPSTVALQPPAVATSIETGPPPSQSSIAPLSTSPVPAHVPASESAQRQSEVVNEGAAHDDRGRSGGGEHLPK